MPRLGRSASISFPLPLKKCLIKKQLQEACKQHNQKSWLFGQILFSAYSGPTARSSLMEEDLLPVLRCCWNKMYQALPSIQHRHGLQPPPATHPTSPPPQALPAPAWDALTCQTREDASHKFHKNKYQRLKITKPRPSQTNALSVRQERAW